MSVHLDDEEIRQAAAEAGISPAELRTALVQREQGDILAPRPSRTEMASLAHARVQLPVEQAVAAVRAALERQTGMRGHAQGSDRADIVDEASGITYRIHASSDGANGALVQVEANSGSASAARMLTLASTLGCGVALVGLGYLFSVTLLWLSGATVAGVGVILWWRKLAAWSVALERARLFAGRAVAEAQDHGQDALPAASP